MKNPIGFFGPAFRGIWVFLATERNAKIHLMAAVLVIFLGFYFHLDANYWLWMLLAIALVFVTELLNTALEKTCDKIEPQKHPLIRDIKDMAAGAVLIASIFALLVALIIFVPLLTDKFFQ